MPANVRVVIDDAAVQKFIRAPDGGVMRLVLVMATAVQVATIASLNPGFPRDFLAPTIVKRVTDSATGPRVLVGSDHTRTEPHIIEGNPTLVFFWEKLQKMMFLSAVNHPGSNFDNYLAEKLVTALVAVRGAL